MTMTVGNLAHDVWHIAAIGFGLLLSVLATGHAVLNKRDPRAATACVGFVWLVPLVGALLYFIFGLNRIRHKAALLRRNLERYRAQTAQPECLPEELPHQLRAYRDSCDEPKNATMPTRNAVVAAGGTGETHVH